MIAPPMDFQWDGDALVPAQRFKKLCDQHFCIGEKYRMEVSEERSMRSHNFYFASIAEAWANLPDDLAERFQTPEHLRKYALIKAGYADERSIACSSKAEAQRVAAFVKPMDDYALVLVKDAVVQQFTAKSQSKIAMGAKDFQASKEAVLDYVASLVGVKREALSANAGRAA